MALKCCLIERVSWQVIWWIWESWRLLLQRPRCYSWLRTCAAPTSFSQTCSMACSGISYNAAHKLPGSAFLKRGMVALGSDRMASSQCFGSQSVMVHKCRTESDAEDYVASETERLWALVVFNSGPSAVGSGMCSIFAHVHCICKACLKRAFDAFHACEA